MDTGLFFPIGGVSASTLAVCRSLCPVRQNCLDEAVTDGLWGIWGGTTSGERRLLRAPLLPDFTSRTTTEITPMDETNADVEEITEALLDGRTVKDVAQAYDWPRQRVTALISRTDGWSLDPRADMVVIGSHHDEPATTAVDLADHDQADELPDEEPGAGAVDLSGLEELLRRAEASDTAATRAAGEKARAAVEDLQQRVNTEAAEKQIRDEIAALEEQLAARQARLKEIRPKATARRPAGDGPTPKEVRAWAAKQGINCSAHGRVPDAIVEQYLAAKAGA
jgi:hypothetical protein